MAAGRAGGRVASGVMTLAVSWRTLHVRGRVFARTALTLTHLRRFLLDSEVF